MRGIEHECKECGHTEKAFKCDSCNQEIGDLTETTIDLTFAYGSCLDGIDYHFCSDECFWNWAKNFPNYIKRGG